MEYAERVGGATPDEAYEVSIGLIECSSIAQGILVADSLLKHSPVELLWSRTISPGHHINLFTGEVEEVREALEAGLAAGADTVVDDLFIPNLHSDVPKAMRGPRPLQLDALAILEFQHIAPTILAADVALKTADVQLVELRLGMHLGGKGFFILTGGFSDVEDAAAAAAAVGHERRSLIREVVIPRAADELGRHLRP